MIWRYGIAYYDTVGQSRVPLTGLSVRLVRPNAAWSSGLVCTETAPGYYEAAVTDSTLCGYYDIWDTRSVPAGARSGKTAILGPLDAAGIQDASNFLVQLSALAAAFNAAPKVHGCDIYIQATEPDTAADFVWIDTSALDFILQ